MRRGHRKLRRGSEKKTAKGGEKWLEKRGWVREKGKRGRE
jgi:hypothetical protein